MNRDGLRISMTPASHVLISSGEEFVPLMTSGRHLATLRHSESWHRYQFSDVVKGGSEAQ